MFGYKQLMIYK